MAGTPRVGTINAERVVVAREIHGGIHAQGGDVVVLTFPSGQGIQRVFASVPAQGPLLVGRDQIFAELQVRAAEGGKLALHGLPGAGKSALALALAYDEATLKRFGGGVLWAGLGSQSNVANILNLSGSALGVDVSTGFDGKPLRTAAERAQRLNAHLQAALGGQPFLVVLDDAWKPEDLLDFESFATPGYGVIVTTRDLALAHRFVDVPERLVRVEELDERAALDLLTRAAPEARAAVPADLGEVARAVGYLPLALVLMGRELAAHAGQERWIRQTVERLRSAEARLELAEDARRPGLAGVPLNLEAVVQLSLDALADEPIRSAFAQLSVFAPKPADFSREAAVAVWRVDEDAGDTYLRTLHEHGLLEITGQDRFTLHQVLAAVATDRLGARPEIAERHCAYYVGFVKSDPEAWSPIEQELHQIQQAWEWAARTPGRDEWVLALVWALRLFMQRRGLYPLWHAWLERTLEAARRLQQPRDEAAVLHNLGMLAGLIGNETALDHYQRALAIRRELGDRSGEAETLNNIGTLRLDQRDEKAALDHYQRALAIRRELGDRSGQAQTLNNIGTVHLHRATSAWFGIDKEELEQALDFFEQALPIVREVHDRKGEGVVLNNIGVIHSRQGDQMAALDHYQRALAVRRELGDLEAQVTTHYNIGMTFQKRDDEVRALDHYQQALATFR